jgi:hypothetical protein
MEEAREGPKRLNVYAQMGGFAGHGGDAGPCTDHPGRITAYGPLAGGGYTRCRSVETPPGPAMIWELATSP